MSEIKISGLIVQVVDYHWDARSSIYDCASDVRLRWRVRPYRVKARGGIKPGEDLSFGQMMLHPADSATHARGADEQEDVRTLECIFDRNAIGRAAGFSVDTQETPLSPCLDVRNADLDHAVRRLTREMLEPGFASRVLIESIGLSIAVDIVRLFGAGAADEDERETRTGRLSTARRRRITDFVEGYEDGSPSLSDVAAECGVSVEHLRRVYKASTGQTLHHYIEDVKVRRAKALLLDTNLPLKVISHKIGFRHSSAFSFAFRKSTGECPRAFRERCAA